jgi:hypothetical protein
MPPAAPLTVTVRRYLPLVRQVRGMDHEAIGGTRNPEMLAAVAALQPADRAARRALGRLVMSAAVALRSQAQERVWFPGDSAPTREEVARLAGVSEVVFDEDVPRSWRPYFLREFAGAVTSLRLVMPDLPLDAVRVRFRMTAPADSALAMHDPRTRTLHLPVLTAAGTLTHELAHDLDRQSALQQGHQGYRSDWVARNVVREKSRGASGSVSASLRALTVDVADSRVKGSERPAEIFATQVDWFVASALASRGIAGGFLSAVQDELLTGHVVHPERLRTGTRGRPLVDALRGMTSLAPFALDERAPGAHALLQWALAAPVDRATAAAILAERQSAWSPPVLDEAACAASNDPRVVMVRMAADTRARGWLRQRARWANARGERAPWVNAVLGDGPWSDAGLERRVARLRDHILLELAESSSLPSGVAAEGAPLAARARCGA